MGHVTVNLDMDGWRGRNDDGSETAATWKAALNTTWSQPLNEIFRVRVRVQETGGGSTTEQLRLQYRLNGGAWGNVNAIGGDTIAIADSTNVTDGINTTQQISSGAFGTGFYEDSGITTGTCSWAGNDAVECEWACILTSVGLSDGDTIELRAIRQGGTILDTQTVFGSFTVSIPAGGNTVEIYDGAAWQAATVEIYDGAAWQTASATIL